MEECPICCLRCEGAIGCPLPDEAILALANVDALNRTPESEELHDGVHRQLASDVPHPCRVVEPMLNGSAPPYPRPNQLDQGRGDRVGRQASDPGILPKEKPRAIPNDDSDRGVEHSNGFRQNLEGDSGPGF
jgi:hypothetical protein